MHYFPKQLMSRINACELAFDPDLMFCDAEEFAEESAHGTAHNDEKVDEEMPSKSAVFGATVSSLLMLGLALYLGLGL